jgi:hypothetical protein
MKTRSKIITALFAFVLVALFVAVNLEEQNDEALEKETNLEQLESMEWINEGCWVYEATCSEAQTEEKVCYFRSSEQTPFVLNGKAITPFQVCKFDRDGNEIKKKLNNV